jgi:hypothetical protein
MIRPAPATQPWLESVNWTASSAGAPVGDEAAGAGAVPPAQDEEAPPGAPVGCSEPSADGAADVPASLGATPAAAVEELDDVVAHPAARPAAASTTIVENTVLRVIKGISYVTFLRTLPLLARS